MKKISNSQIQIRIPEEVKKEFEKYCNDMGTKMSDEIKRYIHSCIKKKDH